MRRCCVKTLGMQIAKVSRWGVPQSQFMLRPTVCSTRPLCWHSQENSWTNCIISTAMLFKQKKMSLFIRWKAIFREWNNYFIFFPVNWCCEILFLSPAPMRFDIWVFIRLHFISGALHLKVMYFSVFWPHGWCNNYTYKVQVSNSGRVSTMECIDFTLAATISYFSFLLYWKWLKLQVILVISTLWFRQSGYFL